MTHQSPPAIVIRRFLLRKNRNKMRSWVKSFFMYKLVQFILAFPLGLNERSFGHFYFYKEI